MFIKSIRGEKMEKNKEKYICNICLRNVDKLTDDHIPPKCCGNNGKARYRKTYFVGDKERREYISQNGTKFHTICSKCNSLLGSKYDKAIKEFIDYCLIKINECKDSFSYKTNIGAVIKGVVGHILATTSFEQSSNSTYDQSLREYFLNDVIPDNYELYLYIYPYKNIVYTAKNLCPIKIKKNKLAKNIPLCLVTVLYFYPFAFIFSEKGSYDGIGLFESLKTNEIRFDKNCNWVNSKVECYLPPFWPLQTDDKLLDGVEGLVGGKDCFYSIISEKKQTTNVSSHRNKSL